MHDFHLFMGYKFLTKNRWFLMHDFHLFTGYKFLTKNRWFLRHDFHLFTGYKFLTKNRWFLRRDFHLFTGYKFLTKNRWFLIHDFHLFMGYKFLTKNRWFLTHDFYLFTGYEFLTKNRWIFGCDFYLFMGYESLVQNGHFMDEFLTFRGYDFHSVICWNLCLTGVWILGTKQAFCGWIFDLSYFNGTIYFMQVDELQYEFPTAGVQYMSHTVPFHSVRHPMWCVTHLTMDGFWGMFFICLWGMYTSI